MYRILVFSVTKLEIPQRRNILKVSFTLWKYFCRVTYVTTCTHIAIGLVVDRSIDPLPKKCKILRYNCLNYQCISFKMTYYVCNLTVDVLPCSIGVIYVTLQIAWNTNEGLNYSDALFNNRWLSVLHFIPCKDIL